MNTADRLITRMEYLRSAMYEKPEQKMYYSGKLDGMKDAFLEMYRHDEALCKYVLEI